MKNAKIAVTRQLWYDSNDCSERYHYDYTFYSDNVDYDWNYVFCDVVLPDDFEGNYDLRTRLCMIDGYKIVYLTENSSDPNDYIVAGVVDEWKN